MNVFHQKRNGKVITKAGRGIDFKGDQPSSELIFNRKSHLFTNGCFKESGAPSRVEKHAAFSPGSAGTHKSFPYNNRNAYSKYSESYTSSNKGSDLRKRNISQEKFLTRHPISLYDQSNYLRNGLRIKSLAAADHYDSSPYSRSSSDSERSQDHVSNILLRYQDPKPVPVQNPSLGSLPRKFVKHEETMPKIWSRIRALAKSHWLTKFKENDFGRCKCGKPRHYASALDLASRDSGNGFSSKIQLQYNSESSREDDSAVDVSSYSKYSEKEKSWKEYRKDEMGKLKRFASSPELMERSRASEVGSTTDSDVDSGIVKHTRFWMRELSTTSTTSASESEYESEHKKHRLRFKTSRGEKTRRRGPVKADHSIPLVIKNKKLKETQDSTTLDFHQHKKENINRFFPEISRYKYSCNHLPPLTFEDDLLLFRQILKQKLMDQTKCSCGLPWKNPEQQPFQKCPCGRYSFADLYNYPSNWPSPDDLYAYIRAFPSVFRSMSSEDGSDSSVYNADQSSMSSVSSSQHIRPTILPDKPKSVETQTSPIYKEKQKLIVENNNNYKIASNSPDSSYQSLQHYSISSQTSDIDLSIDDYLKEAFDNEDNKTNTLVNKSVNNNNINKKVNNKNKEEFIKYETSPFVNKKQSDNGSLTSGHGESCYDSIRSEIESTSSRSTLQSNTTLKSEITATPNKSNMTNTYTAPIIRITQETEDSGHYTSISDEPIFHSTSVEDDLYNTIKSYSDPQEWETKAAIEKLDNVLNRVSWHSSSETITGEKSDTLKKENEVSSKVDTYARIDPNKKRSVSLMDMKDQGVSNPCIATKMDEEIVELRSEPPLPPRRYRSSDLEKYKDIGESRTFMAKIQNKFNEVRKAMSLDRLDKRGKSEKPQRTKIKKITTFKLLFGKKSDKEDKKEGMSQNTGTTNLEDVGLNDVLDEKPNKKTPVQSMGKVLNVNADGTQLIHLVKPVKGPFGFYIAKGTSKYKNGIFVSRMKNSTYSTMLSGLLGIGDEILEINSTIVREKTLQEVYELMINKTELLLQILPYIARKTD